MSDSRSEPIPREGLGEWLRPRLAGWAAQAEAFEEMDARNAAERKSIRNSNTGSES